MSALLARGLVALLALIAAWYALMLLALALKLDPSRVNAISGYRDAYEWLAALTIDDATRGARLTACLGGLATLVVCFWLALSLLPRPRLARVAALTLATDERGRIELAPRAAQRLAQTTAERHPAVGSATASYATGRVDIGLNVRDAAALDDALREVRRDILAAMRVHELPEPEVHVTVTRHRPTTERELS